MTMIDKRPCASDKPLYCTFVEALGAFGFGYVGNRVPFNEIPEEPLDFSSYFYLFFPELFGLAFYTVEEGTLSVAPYQTYFGFPLVDPRCSDPFDEGVL